MASRKKRKKGGKKKSSANKTGGEKLETTLLGYWSKGLFGEFVTLFLRRADRAQKTGAASLFDSAVFNLLLYALFEARDFSLLDGLLPSLQQNADLSQETLAGLRVAEAARDLSRGEASLEQLRSLPEQLPAPFQELREHLASIPERAESSALSEYLDGKRSKARKGEKHLAQAGRFAQQLRELNRLPIRECSTTPFTQLRNKLREVQDRSAEASGRESRVLRDAAVLADLIRELKASPAKLRKPEQVRFFLRRSGFSFSAHPFVRRLWETGFAVGSQLQGPAWATSIRLDLRSLQEGMLSALPEHTERQLQTRDRMAHLEHKRAAKGLFSDIALPLKEPVWSRRERVVLLFALLMRQLDVSRELFEQLSSPMQASLKQLEKSQKQSARQGCEAVLELLPLLQELQPGQNDTATKVLETWCFASMPLPMNDESKRLSDIAQALAGFDAPPTLWLFLLLKGGEIYARADKDPLLAVVHNAASPIRLDEEAVSRAAKLLWASSEPSRVLERWSRCLEASSGSALAEKVLLNTFEEALDPEDEDFFLNLDPWLTMPPELMERLCTMAGEHFALRGLAELTLQKRDRSTPLPGSEKEAAIFLEHPPPAETLYSMLLWMLGFKPTRASDRFLEELMRQTAPYATKEHGWTRLAEALRGHGSAKLASSVWQLWQELGLFADGPHKNDLEQAKLRLKPLASRGKPTQAGAKKGKKGGRKKTLLDEVLEEKRNKKKQGSS